MAPQNTEASNPETTETAPTFDQQVSSVVSSMKQDEKGNYKLPEGDYSEEIKYAANAERRRRTTESNYSKTKLELKAQATLNDTLKNKIAEVSRPNLSAEEQAQLEELKFSDPDAWFKQKSELLSKANANLNTEISELTTAASQQAESDSRIQVLADYNVLHPDGKLTVELIADEIPPRISNKLSSGELSYDQFLVEAGQYIKTPKKVGGIAAKNSPNLGNAGGGAEPSAEAFGEEATSAAYKNMLF
jgi:hypothetical protein